MFTVSAKKGKGAEQGDIALVPLDLLGLKLSDKATEIPKDQRGALILAHGEVTGHTHGLFGNRVKMYHDAALAHAVVVVEEPKAGEEPAMLKHEEHGTIAVDVGKYAVIRQANWDELSQRARQVAD
jgi:hypothetical protein